MESQLIQGKIFQIRGHRVIFNFHLAELYEVETRALKQSVKRNISRFPSDFLIELTQNDIDSMVSQNVIPSRSYRGGAAPYAFTEQGVVMLSSVLRSQKAIDVNIAIMRAFVLLRQHLMDYKDLREEVSKLELENEPKIQRHQ